MFVWLERSSSPAENSVFPNPNAPSRYRLVGTEIARRKNTNFRPNIL